MLSYRDIGNNAFPFYFFVNCLREVRNMSSLLYAVTFIFSVVDKASRCAIDPVQGIASAGSPGKHATL